MDALLSDVDVRGLSAYTVNSGDLKILAMKLQLDLSWSKIYGSTNYIMKGILAEEMPIYGNGSIRLVFVSTVRIETDALISIETDERKNDIRLVRKIY